MIIRKELKKNKTYMILLIVACLLTNLSQLPILVSIGKTQVLAAPGWLLLGVYILLTKRMVFDKRTLRLFFIFYHIVRIISTYKI